MNVIRKSALAVLAFGTFTTTISASPHVVAFSSSPHFSCPDDAPPSSAGLCGGSLTGSLDARAASDLLGFLSSGSTSSDNAFRPLSVRYATAETKPEVVIGVTEGVGLTASALLELLSGAVKAWAGKASSISASLDSAAPVFTAGEAVTTIDVARLASDAESEIFSNGKTDVLTVKVNSENERNDLLKSVREIAQRANGKFALVWTTARVDEKTKVAAKDAAKGGQAGEAAAQAVQQVAAPNAAEAKTNGTEGAQAATNSTTGNGDFNANGSLLKKTSMDPPPITPGIAVGLFVALILILILMPGMMCLYNIQAPQTFEAMDKDEAKKKMQ